MDALAPGFEFEEPIHELQVQIADLRSQDPTAETQDEVRRLRRKLNETIREIYSSLTPWNTVRVARHKDRPYTEIISASHLTSLSSCMEIVILVMIEQC